VTSVSSHSVEHRFLEGSRPENTIFLQLYSARDGPLDGHTHCRNLQWVFCDPGVRASQRRLEPEQDGYSLQSKPSMSFQKSTTYSVRSSSSSRAPSGQVSMTRRSVAPVYRAASIYGGAGGTGSRISSSYQSGVRSSGGGMGLASGLGGGMSSSMQVSSGGESGHIMGNEKFAMQNLNDRLASYLETVRNLEQANGKLEIQIREAMEKSGPEYRDYSKYQTILDDLRRKVFDATVDNARMILQIDNARLAADDFRVKFESELTIRQSVDADIVGLRKLIDDTNMGRMNLESEIEALKEELIHLKKNHDNDVMELRSQVSQSGVQVDVDAPKGQDLSQIMAEIRSKYEKMALKNQEDLKAWHESQITVVQTEVSQNTEALKGAQVELNDLRRQLQTMEIELESQRSLKMSLESSLRDTEMRYNMDVESLNNIIIGLEAELTQLRGNIMNQTQEYEALLNMKMKLEAEIATYRRLLDGEDFQLQDALEHKVTKKTKVMTVTQHMVDGKVVSSSTETKNLTPVSQLVGRPYAHSMPGGAGGHGIRISRSTSAGGQLGSARSSDDHSLGSTSGSFAVGNEKATMQHLNDRLSNYLETVRKLEETNGKLETKIFEFMQKAGPAEGMDYSKYNGIIADLRLDYEMGMRQAVDADISGMRKMLDDTNVVRLHLESDIESLREELITMRKYHEADVAEQRAQITQTGVQVDIDAPKGQDLAKIMDEMRAKYERTALKNQEELKAWHESQDVERRYNMEIEKYNEIILRLQEELSHIRGDTQSQTTEYEILLNIKMKLEAEIAEYRRLLDGEALEESKKTVRILTVTQTMVDGKVVEETKNVRDTV
ncbi:hypothetical protein CRUP_011189, partial [Coryphaenoides rupestris]